MNPLTVRDVVIGEGSPKICVPIVAHTAKELEESLAQVARTEYDMVEFRADFYFEEDAGALKRIREAVGNCPLVYTIRTSEEGGEIEIPEDEYEARILRAAPLIDLADIQLERLHMDTQNGQLHSRIIPRLHEAGVKVIGSWHCFTHTPDVHQMIGKMKAMQEEDCDISKIAVMPQNRSDVVKLILASLEMMDRHADRPYITMSMGSLGRITRAGASFTGSCISFGMAGESSAPGQIPASQLRQVLRVLECR